MFLRTYYLNIRLCLNGTLEIFLFLPIPSTPLFLFHVSACAHILNKNQPQEHLQIEILFETHTSHLFAKDLLLLFFQLASFVFFFCVFGARWLRPHKMGQNPNVPNACIQHKIHTDECSFMLV